MWPILRKQAPTWDYITCGRVLLGKLSFSTRVTERKGRIAIIKYCLGVVYCTHTMTFYFCRTMFHYQEHENSLWNIIASLCRPKGYYHKRFIDIFYLPVLLVWISKLCICNLLCMDAFEIYDVRSCCWCLSS